MSFDQRLISRREQGLFAKSWIAGTTNSLLKYYQRHDIETLNVSDTCEKLRLTVTQSRSELKQKEICEPNDAATKVPFRVATNICYGTLRIYQFQVNSLLEKSKNLVARSCIEININSRKRHSTFSTTASAKKRRNSKSKQNTFIANYTELLNEMENLANFTCENLDITFMQPTFGSLKETHKKQLSNYTTREITIRKITIREMSGCVESEFEVENNNGFGDATAEELTAFFDFFADKPNDRTVDNNLKRKAKEDEQLIHKNKICKHSNYNATYNNDAPIEMERCVYSAMTAQNEFDCNINFSTYNLNTSEQMPQSSTLDALETCDIAPQTNIITNSTFKNFIPAQLPTIQNLTQISKANAAIDNKEATATQTAYEIKRTSQLVIDKCIKLSDREMCAQKENYKRLQRTNVFCNTTAHLSKRSIATANGLLNMLNRNIKNAFTLTHKPKLSKAKQSTDYVNILRDIFKTAFHDNLANEIYPKWQVANKSTRKRKLPNNANNIVDGCSSSKLHTTTAAQMHNYDLNNNDAFTAITLPHLPAAMYEEHFNRAANADIGQATQTEWSPYGVMMKLLDIWRYATTDAIDVQQIYFSVKTRAQAAKTFAALLLLARDNFIVINTKVNSNELQSVELGIASDRLINDFRINMRRKA